MNSILSIALLFAGQVFLGAIGFVLVCCGVIDGSERLLIWGGMLLSIAWGCLERYKRLMSID